MLRAHPAEVHQALPGQLAPLGALPAAWGPDHQITFWIDFADSFDEQDDQKFQGYLTTGDHGMIATITWWRDIPFGFVANGVRCAGVIGGVGWRTTSP